MSEATPLHVPEAEAALVGGLLAGARQSTEILARLDGDAFYLSSNRFVYEATVAVHLELGRIDPAAVVDRLREVGRLEAVGGASALHDLVATGFVSSPSIAHHADRVLDAARRRRLADAGRRIVLAADDPTADVDAAVDEAVSSIFETSTARPISRAEDAWAPLLDRLAGLGPKPLEIGLPATGKYVRWLPGQLTVVTGTPSAGKSEIVDAVALHMARAHGWRWAVYSPEADPFDAWLAAMIHRMLGHWPDTGMFDGPDIDEKMRWLHDRFAWLDVDAASRLPTLLAQARWLARDAGLDGLIVDPWNKVVWDRERGESTTEAIGRHLATIVRFARSEQVHVVIVAHPRKMEQNSRGGHKVPTAYDISGSSEWYNQADFVLSVARGSEGGVDVHVQKVKRQPEWGRPGTVSMRFDQTSRRYLPTSPV